MTAAAGNYRVWVATEMGQDDIMMTSGLSDHGNINPGIIMFIKLTSVWQQHSVKGFCHGAPGHLSQMMVSELLSISKWSCRDCCLGSDIVYDIFPAPLTSVVSASSLPPSPALFTFLVGRYIIRRHPTSHFLSPRVSQEPLEGHFSGRQKNTFYWPLSYFTIFTHECRHHGAQN